MIEEIRVFQARAAVNTETGGMFLRITQHGIFVVSVRRNRAFAR